MFTNPNYSGSEPGDDGFFGSWHCRVAEDSLENGDAASDNDVIGNIFHDGRSLASHKGQEDGSLVQVPEEEELTATGSRRAHVTKQAGVGVPKDSIKAQNNLKIIQTLSIDRLLNQTRSMFKD